MSEDTTVFCGVDIADRASQMVVIDHDGQVLEQSRVRTTPEAMKRFFGARDPMRVAMEVGTHSPWLSRLVASCGHEVHVANARKLRFIFQNERKSDQNDAELLARVARFDPQLLCAISHVAQADQAARAVLRTRDVLVRSRVQLTNHVRGVVKAFGQQLPPCSTASFPRLWPVVPEALQPALAPLFSTLETINAGIVALEVQMEQLIQQQYPEAQHLQQIPGVGPVTSLAFVLAIGDPSRFRSCRAVGAYLGLVPRRSQTGECDPQLRISKTGSPAMRRLLVGCAHRILGRFGHDCALRRAGERISARGGKSAKKRAAVAVARRLAVVMLSLLRSGQDYEPFHGLMVAESAET